jgi:ribosomal protein S5
LQQVQKQKEWQTAREKVVQKAGRDILRVPREDPKESLSIDRVVEAG